eukprot:scaffold199460_cov27-Tisochrysis_lutea.AAC.1
MAGGEGPGKWGVGPLDSRGAAPLREGGSFHTNWSTQQGMVGVDSKHGPHASPLSPASAPDRAVAY